MKRSLLSKLLAGVMSLGMITGGSSIQNVYAMEKEWDEDDDWLYENIKSRKQLRRAKSYNDVYNKGMRVLCIYGDIIPLIGPVLGHVACEKPLEGLIALGTLCLTTYAINNLPENLLTENEKHTFKEFVNVLDRVDRKDDNGNYVDEKGSIVVTKDKVDLLNSRENKKWLGKLLPATLYYFGWIGYDISQLVNKK